MGFPRSWPSGFTTDAWFSPSSAQLGAGGADVKVGEEIVRILEAFDLTQSYRAAGELAGCDHHTVRKYVLLRDAGQVVLERPQWCNATA